MPEFTPRSGVQVQVKDDEPVAEANGNDGARGFRPSAAPGN